MGQGMKSDDNLDVEAFRAMEFIARMQALGSSKCVRSSFCC